MTKVCTKLSLKVFFFLNTRNGIYYIPQSCKEKKSQTDSHCYFKQFKWYKNMEVLKIAN